MNEGKGGRLGGKALLHAPVKFAPVAAPAEEAEVGWGIVAWIAIYMIDF